MVAGQRPFPITSPYTRPVRPRIRYQVGRRSAQPTPPSISISIPARPNDQREQQEREPELEVAHERAAATRSGTVTKLYPFGPR